MLIQSINQSTNLAAIEFPCTVQFQRSLHIRPRKLTDYGAPTMLLISEVYVEYSYLFQYFPVFLCTERNLEKIFIIGNDDDDNDDGNDVQLSSFHHFKRKGMKTVVH